MNSNVCLLVFPCILLVVTFWPRALSIGQTFAVKMSERDTQFPNTLKEFGYTFNGTAYIFIIRDKLGFSFERLNSLFFSLYLCIN